jgi:hypothetical protein
MKIAFVTLILISAISMIKANPEVISDKIVKDAIDKVDGDLEQEFNTDDSDTDLDNSDSKDSAEVDADEVDEQVYLEK